MHAVADIPAADIAAGKVVAVPHLLDSGFPDPSAERAELVAVLLLV